MQKKCSCVSPSETTCPRPEICKYISNDVQTFIAGVKEATRWIPVEDDLPEVDKNILLKGYCEDENVTYYDVGYLHVGNSHTFICGAIWKVTHWRPIEFE